MIHGAVCGLPETRVMPPMQYMLSDPRNGGASLELDRDGRWY